MSRKVLLVSSVVAHGAAVVTLVVAGWWSIEKLDYEGERVATLYQVAPDRPMPGGGDGKLPPLKPKKKGSEGDTQQARKAVNDVQPVPLVEEDIDAKGDQGGDEDGEEDGNEWGHKYGKKGGTGKGLFIDGDGDCRMPECGSAIPTVEIDDDDEEDKIVTPDVMRANRKSGTGEIAPPRSVKLEMVRNGETRTRAAVKICVTTSGKVRDASFIKKTGYDAYDAKLLREIRKWEYQPFTFDGKAHAACSVTHIIFNMR